MSLALAVALNLIAVVGLLAALAYAMTRPARLKPHVARQAAPVVELQVVRAREQELERAA